MTTCKAAIALTAILASGTAACAITHRPSNRADTQPVVLVLQRNHRLHVFDAKTLTLLGYFVTGTLGDPLSVRPDGRMVFLLQQAGTGNDVHCCSLQALDLETRRLCPVADSANVPVVSSDRIVLASGTPAFDAHTLNRIGDPQRQVCYGFRIASDGRWFFAISRAAPSSAAPSLELIDPEGALVRQLPLRADLAFSGDAAGNGYYLLGPTASKGRSGASRLNLLNLVRP